MRNTPSPESDPAAGTPPRRRSLRRRLVAFEMLNDAVTHHWIAEERHLYPFLDRLDYRELYASIEQHRALCHIMADLHTNT